MLQLTNQTPFQAERCIQIDRLGNQVWVVVVKGTFRLGPGPGEAEPRPDGEPVCLAPEYLGEPGRSGLKREAEMIAEHPGTDVTLIGSAHAPGRRPVKELDVSLKVGPLSKSAKVFGDRVWESSLTGTRPGAARPFLTMPLTYERAFGGSAMQDPKNPGATEEIAANPVGRGFYLRASDAAGHPLPNVEDPADLIRSWSHRPGPVGFGPVPAGWSPRKELAGTFDEAWKRDRMPVWPVDHDPRHHRSAPPDLVTETPLRGGEAVELVNLTPESRRVFRLPRVFLVVETLYKGQTYRQAVQLDRVILQPDDDKLVMVWRSWMNCHNNARKVEMTTVRTKPYLR